MTKKVCTKCFAEKDLSMFSLRDLNQGKRKSRCKECIAQIARDRQYSLHTQQKADQRTRRLAQGKCRYCKEICIPGKKACQKHYVVEVSSRSLGIGDTKTANELLKRFQANPYCPYTGERLHLGVNAHLDHILSLKNRPDLKGDIDNVEWISETANLSKNGFNKDEFIEFCKTVARRYE